MARRLVVVGLLFALWWHALARVGADHWSSAHDEPEHHSMHVLQVVHAHHGTSALAGAGVDALSHLLVDDASQVTGLIAEPARGEARACGAECPEARARAAESVLSDRLFRPPRFAG